jgi:hypothetical protein
MSRDRSLPSTSDHLVASTEIGESPGAPPGAFLMSEFLWSRHANPWSVWTAVAAFPLLVLALYRRSRSLLGGVLLFVTLNPLLFRPPSDDRAWATRVVLGEQVWLDDGVLPSREAAMAAASAPVYLATFAAALRKWRWGTLGGTVLSMTLMLRFFARMVQRYDEQAATAPAERSGFLVGPHSCVTAPIDRAVARRLR